MSAAFLSSASSTIRRASRAAGARTAGARRARGRACRRRVGAVADGRVRDIGGFGHDRGFLHDGSVEPMVADVGRDRIRDEVAQRPAGRGARPQRRSPTGAMRGPSRNDRPVRERRADAGRAKLAGRRPDSRPAARRRAGPAPGRAAARARSAARRTPRPTGSATRSAAPPRDRPRAASSSVSTVYDGPGRSSSTRLDARTAGLSAIASSTIASRSSAGRDRPARLVRRLAGRDEQHALEAERLARPPRRPRGGRGGSGRTCRRRRRASRARSRGPSVTRAPRAAAPIRARSPPIRTVSPGAMPARRSSASIPSRARSRWKRSADSSTSKLVWAAIRSIRRAADAEGAVRLELDAEAVAHRLDAVDDDAGRLRRLVELGSASGSSSASLRAERVEALAGRRGDRDRGRCPSAVARAPERRPGLGGRRQVDLVERDEHRLLEERRIVRRAARRG